MTGLRHRGVPRRRGFRGARRGAGAEPAAAAAATAAQATAALRRAATLLAVLGPGALLTGRPELVVLAAPLAAGTVLALLAGRAGTGAPVATARAGSVLTEGAPAALRVGVDTGTGSQLAVVRLPEGASVPHGRWAALAVDRAGRRDVDLTVTPPGWGRVMLARPDLLAVGPDALLVRGPASGQERTVTVLPAMPAAGPLPLPARPAGLVGTHRTRRPGDGSDLLDVREMRPGDRVRRIDWRVTARRGALHVRRTAVDAEADVVLCLDTRLDVGADVAGWPGPPGPGPRGGARPGSSLDLGVHAAAAVAEAHLRAGDRVALVDLAQPRRGVPPGTGRRQLRRIQGRLATTGVDAAARRLLVRRRLVPAGAVVVLLTPALDEPVTALAATLRRRGGVTVLVDTLPAPLHPPGGPGGDVARDAMRLVLAERAARLAGLRALGVAVVPPEPATLAARLRRLRRAARGGP